MASESNLLSVAWYVAAANYWNPASALAGPGGSGQFLAVAVSAVADHTVVLASGAGQKILGILQNKPALGEVAEVAIHGITKAMVGAAGSTRGSPQMVDATGAITDWTAGTAKAQIGYAGMTGVSGQVIDLVLGPTSTKVLT